MYNPNQPLSEGNSLLLSLSVEELTLITAAMHIPSFLGFRPPSPLPVAAAQAAERSLRLRGIAAGTPDGKFTVDTNIARLLSVCAVPKHMLVVQQDFARQEGYFEKAYEKKPMPRLHFFCVYDSAMVYQNRSVPGLHTFATISSPEMLKVMLATILQCSNVEKAPDTDAPSYRVDRTSLLNAESQNSADAIYDRMVNDLNAPPSLAKALASRKKHLLGVVWRNDWQEEGYAYTENTLLEDTGYIAAPAEEGGFWVYSFEGDKPKMAVFDAVSGVTLIDDIVNRLHVQMGII